VTVRLEGVVPEDALTERKLPVVDTVVVDTVVVDTVKDSVAPVLVTEIVEVAGDAPACTLKGNAAGLTERAVPAGEIVPEITGVSPPTALAASPAKCRKS
jgi:hypothetical protein